MIRAMRAIRSRLHPVANPLSLAFFMTVVGVTSESRPPLTSAQAMISLDALSADCSAISTGRIYPVVLQVIVVPPHDRRRTRIDTVLQQDPFPLNPVALHIALHQLIINIMKDADLLPCKGRFIEMEGGCLHHCSRRKTVLYQVAILQALHEQLDRVFPSHIPRYSA